MSRLLGLKILASVLFVGLLVGGSWFVATRRALPPEFSRKITSPAQRLTTLMSAASGQQIVAGGADGEVVVLDVPSEQIQSLEPKARRAVVSLAESPDGLLLATGLGGDLRAWQVADWRASKIESPEVTVTAVAFRTTERQILLGLADGRIAVLTSAGLKLRKSGHRGVKALLWDEKRDVLITAGTEGKLIWHEFKSDKPLAVIEKHRTEIACLRRSPSGAHVVSADWNGMIHWWDAKTRTLVQSAQQDDAVAAMDWHGERLVTGSWDGRIRVWASDSNSARLLVTINTGLPIHGLAVVKDRDVVATVSGSANIEFWKLEK